MGWFSKDHVVLETLMNFQLRSREPGVAAVRWTLLRDHPTLSETQLRIDAACFNFSVLLVGHDAARERLSMSCKKRQLV
jgi:hypothetical protein